MVLHYSSSSSSKVKSPVSVGLMVSPMLVPGDIYAFILFLDSQTRVFSSVGP